MQLQQDDSPHLYEIAEKVKFSTEQMARLCGISRRQLSYWMQRGFIPSEEVHSLAALEKALLIRRELDRGKSLKQAVQHANQCMAGQQRREAEMAETSTDGKAAILATTLDVLDKRIAQASEIVPGLTDPEVARGLHSRLEQLQIGAWLDRRAASEPIDDQVRWLERVADQLGVLLDETRQHGESGESHG